LPREVLQKVIIPLWNAYSFFVTYARIDKYEPEFSIDEKISDNKLDRWIFSATEVLIGEVTERLEAYDATKAALGIEKFIDDLTNWYIRRSRRRFWKSENDADKKQAYDTLYHVLVTLTKVMAPFMPFVTEEMYQNLVLEGVSGARKTEPESVHLTLWPKSHEALIDEELNREMRAIKAIVTLGRAARERAQVKTRQPLSKITVASGDPVVEKISADFLDLIKDELNVKEVEFVKEAKDFARVVVKLNGDVVGPKYGDDAQKVFKAAERGEDPEIDDGKLKLGEFALEADEFEIGYEGADGVQVESVEGFVVGLDMEVTEELKMEGMARELVRSIQDLRKKADYEVDDRIELRVVTGTEVKAVFDKFADYIRKETLADGIVMLEEEGDVDESEDIKLEGHEVWIGVKR